MKKIVSSLLAGAIAFSTFSVGNVTPSSAPTVASAKSTAKLLDEGGDKVLKYLYSKNPSYKKTRVLITEQRKLKSGNLFYGVHEDNPKSPAMMRIGFYKLTKKSGYKHLYEYDVIRDRYKLVKKFKK